MGNVVFYTINFLIALAVAVITSENLLSTRSTPGVFISTVVVVLTLAPSAQRLMKQSGANPDRWWWSAAAISLLSTGLAFVRNNYLSATGNEIGFWIAVLGAVFVIPYGIWRELRHVRKNRLG